MERDRAASDQLERHRESTAASQADHTRAIESGTAELRRLLEQNTELTSQDKALTEQIAVLTREIKELLSTGSARM